jgi:hypothetical protein
MKPANALAMPLSAKLGLAGLFALVTVMVLFAAPLAAQPINVITVDCTPFVSPNFTSFGPDNTMGMSLQMVDQGTDFNVTEVTPAAFRALTAAQLSAFDLIAINNNPSRIDCGSGLGLGTTWHSVIGVNVGGRVLLSSHDAARFKIIIPPGGAFFGLGAPGPGIEPFGADELVRQAALWAGGGAQTGLLIFNDSARFFTVAGAGWNNPELNLPAAWGITDLDQTGGGPTDGGYTDILPAFQTHAAYAGLSDARFGVDSVSSFAANIADGSFHSIFGSFNATIFTPTEVVVNAGVIDVGGFNAAFGIGAFLSPAGPDGSAITLIRENAPPDCSGAVAAPDLLWPPNHKFADVSVVGVNDPDGDPVTITITDIAQDEPLEGLGDGNTCPDADGVGTDIASVRVERSGSKKVPGDGRVYHISFTADDGQGGQCAGAVTVCVPHDQRPGHVCVDQGPLFDSTSCP